MFSLFKKKKKEEPQAQEVVLAAFATGRATTLEELADGVFSEKMLGDGMVIVPSEGVLVAPAAGKVAVVMADSGHAVGLELAGGTQLLLHVGLETVNMGGKGFELLVAEGDTVTTGQPLINFDRDVIAAAGCPDSIVMVIAEAGGMTDYHFTYPEATVAGETQVGELKLG